MKVLYLIPDIRLGGGAERSLFDLAPGLAPAGIELSILYQHERSAEAAAAYAAMGVPASRLAATSLVGQVREVHRWLLEHRPDILHTTLYEADLVGRLAAIGTPVRVMTSLVNTSYEPARYAEDQVARWRLEVVRHLEGFTGRHLCDRIHANSAAVEAAAIRAFHLDPARISVVHRGRDPEPLAAGTAAQRARTREALGLAPGAEVVLSIGRHEAQKGQIYLVRALPAILDHHPDAIVLVAGRDGAATPGLVAAATEAGVMDHIRLLGNRDDIGDVLACADVLAFPSLWEGLPGTIIEAMAVGTPIVASAIAPVTELVDDQLAVLVAPADPVDLARGIVEVLDHPVPAAERAARAQERFLAGFTIAHAQAAMIELYRAVAAAPIVRRGARADR